MLSIDDTNDPSTSTRARRAMGGEMLLRATFGVNAQHQRSLKTKKFTRDAINFASGEYESREAYVNVSSIKEVVRQDRKIASLTPILS